MCVRLQPLRPLQYFIGVLEYHLCKWVPKVVDRGQLIKRRVSTAVGFVFTDDFAEFGDVSHITIGPSNLPTLADVVAADILYVGEECSRLLHRLPMNGLAGRLVRLDSTGRYAPSSPLDVHNQHAFAIPREHERGKRAQGGAKRRRKELKALPPILSSRKPLQRLRTFPRTSAIGRGPNRRLSSDSGKLSPRT